MGGSERLGGESLSLSVPVRRLATGLAVVIIVVSVVSFVGEIVSDFVIVDNKYVDRIVEWIDVNREGSIPTWYATITLASCAVLLGLIAVDAARHRKPFPFLQTPANELRGRFSPDGRWIAYVSNESGRNDVYVAPFSGRGSKWQISAAGGNFPRWRRDGKEIFYLAPDNTLMSVGVNGAGSAFETGTVRPLFQARVSIQARWMYDVSPDGQRFLVNALAQETTSVPLTLLVNWASLLTQ